MRSNINVHSQEDFPNNVKCKKIIKIDNKDSKKIKCKKIITFKKND